jgi:hypothetical protein
VVNGIQRMLPCTRAGAEDDHEAIFTSTQRAIATHFAEFVLVLVAFCSRSRSACSSQESAAVERSIRGARSRALKSVEGLAYTPRGYVYCRP